MAQLIYNIPDNQFARLRDGLCGSGGYQETINIGTEEEPQIVPNPQSKAQFAKERIAFLAKSDVRQYERRIALEAARDAQDSAEEIDIT